MKSVVMALMVVAGALGPMQVQALASKPGPGVGLRYRVSLLTVSPGTEMEERLGHSALAIEDLQTDTALAYNFGTFGETEYVALKFLHQRLPFWVSAYNPGEIAVRYREREIRTQELELSDVQAERLAKFLSARVLPQNRAFDYDLYTANCVTPIRDLLDMALDGALRRHNAGPASRSFRQAVMQGFSEMPLLAALSALIYGPYTDVPRSRYEMLFMSDALHDAIAELRTSDAPDAPSLVRHEKTWRGQEYQEPLPLPNPWFAAVVLAPFLLYGGLGLLSVKRRAKARRLLAGLAVILALIGAALGIGIYYLGFTPHPSVAQNANRFLFNPIDLCAVPFLILLRADKLQRRGIRFLLLILGGTTIIAVAHAVLGHAGPGGHGLIPCPQQHLAVVAWALLGRSLLWLCILPALLFRLRVEGLSDRPGRDGAR